MIRFPELTAPSSFGRLLAIIVIADAALVVPFAGMTTLWNIDEGRIAEAAREMAVTGDWITPRIGGRPFPAYPPLAYWLMGASGTLLGFSEFAMRLPSALAGLGLVAVTGLLARRLAGGRAGIAAAAILATLPGFYHQQTTCRADVITTLFAALSFERFLAWAEGSPKLRNLVFMYLYAALGWLAKGPIAMAIIGLGGLSWFLIRRRWALLRSMGFSWGLPLALFLIVPWYLLIYQANGFGFLHENILLENVSAFATGFQQKRPAWFYVTAVPVATAPWIAALALAWRWRKEPGLAFALAWTGAVFAFLSISGAKRPSYVTYLCPAAAIAAGIIVARACAEAPSALQKGLVGLALLILLAGAVAYCVPADAWTGHRLRQIATLIPSLGAAAALGAAGMLFLTLRHGATAGTAAMTAALAAGMLVERCSVSWEIDSEGREGVAFCRRAASAIPPGERLAALGPEETEGAYHFYCTAPLPYQSGEPGLYLVADYQRDRLISAGTRLRILDSVQDRRGRSKYLLRIE